MDYDVPFVANTPDDLNCVPASYGMILGYFLPHQSFTLKQLAAITGKPERGGAWAATGHLWLVDHGFEVEYWTPIDWPAFIQRGYDYLKDQFGTEVADYQAANGDIAQEQTRAAKALAKVKTHQREPHIADIKRFLKQGYLVRCAVNSRRLNDKAGYVGHSIVVKGYSAAALIIHDPGLPPQANRLVPFSQFEAAWASPNAAAKELMAIRPVDSINKSLTPPNS